MREIQDDGKTVLNAIPDVDGKQQLAHVFGHAKNARLYIIGGRIESHGGHVNWAMDQSKERIRNEIRNDVRETLAYVDELMTAKRLKVHLPIVASRESATWKIDEGGVVTSHIDYTAGAGVGSKKYATALVVEYADGSVDTRSATKTVGRPPVGSRSGTEKNTDHDALNVDKLNQIRRVYVKYARGSSGPGRIRDWIDLVRGWAKEGEEIYKELKENELVEDAVKLYLGAE